VQEPTVFAKTASDCSWEPSATPGSRRRRGKDLYSRGARLDYEANTLACCLACYELLAKLGLPAPESQMKKRRGGNGAQGFR
jgi:hypothetical protein